MLESIYEQWKAQFEAQAAKAAKTTTKEYVKAVESALRPYMLGSGSKKDAVEDLRERLSNLGLINKNGEATIERISNLGSSIRLNLVVDTNKQIAHSMAQKMTASDPIQQILRPAFELVRNQTVKQPRPWPQIWNDAAKIVNWSGVAKNTDRMVALVDSPIWSCLGNYFSDSIGTEVPPFLFGSHMMWRTVTRKECIALGILKG